MLMQVGFGSQVPAGYVRFTAESGLERGPGATSIFIIVHSANLSQSPDAATHKPAAPVSHQKDPQRNATNAIESEQKHSKINETDRYPPAHNGLVAGSSPAGPTSVLPRPDLAIRGSPTPTWEVVDVANQED